MLRRTQASSITLVLLAMAASACQPATRTAVQPAYRVVVVDQPAAQQFAITLQSDDQRVLCLEYGAWPSALAGPPISLHTSGVILPRRAALPLEPYCPGGCGNTRVPPGGRISAEIPYRDFGEPEEIAALSARELEFVPEVAVCPK